MMREPNAGIVTPSDGWVERPARSCNHLPAQNVSVRAEAGRLSSNDYSVPHSLTRTTISGSRSSVGRAPKRGLSLLARFAGPLRDRYRFKIGWSSVRIRPGSP